MEGAVVGAYLMYRDLREQLYTNYRCWNTLEWDLNSHIMEASSAYKIALYAGYCSNIKTQLMLTQEFKLWLIAKEYGFEPQDALDSRIKREIETRLKAKKGAFDLKLEESFIDGIATKATIETIRKIMEKNGCTVSDNDKTKIIRENDGKIILKGSVINMKDIHIGFLSRNLKMENLRQGIAAEIIDQIYSEIFNDEPPLFFPAEVFSGTISSSEIPQDVRNDPLLMAILFKDPNQCNLLPKIKLNELNALLATKGISEESKATLISLFIRAQKASSIKTINRGLQMMICIPRLMNEWDKQQVKQ
jgi:hypothetical protein